MKKEAKNFEIVFNLAMKQFTQRRLREVSYEAAEHALKLTKLYPFSRDVPMKEIQNKVSIFLDDLENGLENCAQNICELSKESLDLKED